MAKGPRQRSPQTILMLTFVLVPTLSAMASTFFVASDGTGDVATIQDAVNASVDGDTILLGDGVFEGDGNRGVFIADVGLVIRSVSGDPTSCIIDCGGSGGELHTGFQWDSGNETSALEGVSITGGNGTGILAGYGAAVHVVDAVSLTMRNCRVYGNMGIAVQLISIGDCVMEDCAVFGNFNPSSSGPAGVRVGVSAQIVSCTIAGNRGRVGGISMGLAALLDIYNSVIWGNCATLGGQYDQIFANDGLVQIHCSVVDSSGVGSFQPAVLYGYGNVFTNPVFCDPAPCEDAPTDAGDYHVDVTSPCLPPGNPCATLIGALGVNCTGATPTLETSWGAIKERYHGQNP